jgi:hypothetical protein
MPSKVYAAAAVAVVLAGAAVGIAVLAGPATAGGPTSFVVANSVATGDQDNAAVAANRIGDVAVAWEDDRDSTNPGDDTHSEIFLRLFRNGTSAYELKLSAGGTSGAAWRHVQPDVGLDDRGNAVVVWAEDPDGNGFYNITYRVVSPTGSVLGSGQANASADGQQIHPRVGVDPDGAPTAPAAVAFSVVWEDIQGSAPATVKAAGFTATTTKAYEVTVNATGGSHHNPDVAVSASGDATVVWDEDTDNNGFFNIGLVRLAKANGSIVLSRRSANTNGSGQQQRPAIAASFNGDFVVAWESDHTATLGVWARSFTAAGTGVAPEVEISTGTGAGAPTVGIDDQTDAVVGWSVAGADPAVWARGLNADGTFAGRLPAQSFSQVATGRQEQLAVASSPFGVITAGYTDDNDGNSFDQVVLSLGASNADF